MKKNKKVSKVVKYLAGYYPDFGKSDKLLMACYLWDFERLYPGVLDEMVLEVVTGEKIHRRSVLDDLKTFLDPLYR